MSSRALSKVEDSFGAASAIPKIVAVSVRAGRRVSMPGMMAPCHSGSTQGCRTGWRVRSWTRTLR